MMYLPWLLVMLQNGGTASGQNFTPQTDIMAFMAYALGFDIANMVNGTTFVGIGISERSGSSPFGYLF